MRDLRRWIVVCIAVCLAPSGCQWITLPPSLQAKLGGPQFAEMQRLSDFQERLKRGDRDGVRHDLENASEVGVLSLFMLAGLEHDAGDFGAELAALSDATEGLMHDIDSVQRVGGAGTTNDSPMLPPLISNLASIEGQADDLVHQPTTQEEARGLLFWLMEQRKGRFFDALEFDARATTPDGQRTLAELRQARAQQVTRYFGQLGNGTAAAQPAQSPASGSSRDELSETVGQLERKLLASPPKQAADVMQPYVSVGRPRAKYPKGSPAAFQAKVIAAIAPDARYISYNRLSGIVAGPAGSYSAQPTEARPPQYVAMVAGTSGIAEFTLGDADDIDRLVDSALGLIAHHPADPAQPPDAALLAALQAVYDRVWRPLLPALQGSQHVFIAGDGALEQLPFVALHDGERWLFERTTLSQLHSARDFFAPTWSAGEVPAVVLAYPGLPATASDEHGAARRLPRLEAPQLLTAGAEARAVHQRLADSAIAVDAEVTKARILALPHPRILHIASHAFYIPDQPATAPAAAGQRGLTIQSAEPNPMLDLLRRPEEGWMRSALILGPPPAATGPDRAWAGVVTAYEIMAMDLRSTQLVTLSACETGRGTVFGRHGITSLQRAFLVAGAESVLATLWRIDDKATPDWIGAFYDAIAAGRTRAQAVQDAMKAQIATRPHPYYWAAFELTGAIGPIRPLSRR